MIISCELQNAVYRQVHPSNVIVEMSFFSTYCAAQAVKLVKLKHAVGVLNVNFDLKWY